MIPAYPCAAPERGLRSHGQRPRVPGQRIDRLDFNEIKIHALKP